MGRRVRRERSRGLALVTVLLVGFLVVLLATTLVAIGALDYRMANQQVDHARAFEAAQAALAQATYNLADDASWGTHGEILQATMGTDGSSYMITFAPTSVMPRSTNNMTNTAAV